jgi:hypothetical protein
MDLLSEVFLDIFHNVKRHFHTQNAVQHYKLGILSPLGPPFHIAKNII